MSFFNLGKINQVNKLNNSVLKWNFAYTQMTKIIPLMIQQIYSSKTTLHSALVDHVSLFLYNTTMQYQLTRSVNLA